MNKQELIALTKELLEEENLDERVHDLQVLKREYKYYLGRDEDSFYEQEETDKFIALFNELAKREPKLLSSAYDEKKKIIEAARKLLDKKEILAANRELDKLSEDFKKAGRCNTKEQDDELWNEFRQVKDEFYAKKRAFFEELDKANAEKRAKKEREVVKVITKPKYNFPDVEMTINDLARVLPSKIKKLDGAYRQLFGTELFGALIDIQKLYFRMANGHLEKSVAKLRMLEKVDDLIAMIRLIDEGGFLSLTARTRLGENVINIQKEIEKNL